MRPDAMAVALERPFRAMAVVSAAPTAEPPVGAPSRVAGPSVPAATICSAIQFGVGTERVVHRRLAGVDQLAAQPGVMHRPAVIAGIDDADHGGEELRQIGGAADLIQHAGMLEFGLQRHRIGELPRLDAPHDRLIDAAVDRVGELLVRAPRSALIALLLASSAPSKACSAWMLVGIALGQPEQRRIVVFAVHAP